MKLTEIFFLSEEVMKNAGLLDEAVIEKADIGKMARTVNVTLKCEKILPKQLIIKLSRDIKEKYRLNSVHIKTIYKQELFSEDYIEQIIYYMGIRYPHLNYFIKDCKTKAEGNLIKIILKGNGLDIIKYNELDIIIKNLIMEEFGIEFTVEFVSGLRPPTEDELLKKAQAEKEAVKKAYEEGVRIKEENAPPPEAEKPAKQPNKYPRVTFVEAEISSLTPESGMVTICGDLFKTDRRDFANSQKGKLTLYVTDYKSSVMCEIVAKKEELDELAEIYKPGVALTVSGETVYNKYIREFVLDTKPRNIEILEKTEKTDNAAEKRVELHLHTNMSAVDGVNPIGDYISLVKKWGHKAVAITDHGVVQAFPDAYAAAKKAGIKLIYGVEGYLVNDTLNVVSDETDAHFDDIFTVFDIETTGLNASKDKITEIGACKIKGGEIVERFSTFVNPKIPIPVEITKLTGITDEMVKDAPEIGRALSDFRDFAGDSLLVAHNASFDTAFIKQKSEEEGIDFSFVSVDTLALSRALYPNLKKHRLDAVCEHLKIELKGHHRAVNDAEATAQIFIKLLSVLKDKGITEIKALNHLEKDGETAYKRQGSYHIIILVRNKTGLKNLYKLISASHIDYYYRTPRIPRSLLIKHREGLILGSACEAGELYKAVLEGKPREDLLKIADFYDYLEVQPIGNNQYLIDNRTVSGPEGLIEINKRIIEIGDILSKRVVATGDVHYLEERGALYRSILMAGKKFKDSDNQPPLYYRTTDEMLNEFSYLPKEKAFELVVTNTNAIADEIEENFEPVPGIKHPPEIEGSAEEIEKTTYERAYEIYGDPLPELVDERIKKELASIINNGFAVMYLIAQKLVSKSLSDGYLVGSRGSVGSSLVAFLTGITEVNSLSAHYICPKCKYSEFITDGSYSSGCDMPDKECPQCFAPLKKDGHDIPFETFLGFEGDKEPDIDLNFSGEYQPTAHQYIEELFGEGHVFRAGTIGTIAEKTAYGYIKNYYEERGRTINAAEMDRLVAACTGVKQTTGQHPGGIMIVPKKNEVYEFTPVQHPANDKESGIITTHFDYHKLHDTLLKLDILGHDDPTILRMLKDLSGVDPISIPLDDPKTMSLFTSTKALGITPEDAGSNTGTLGVPEFGTRFVRQMLDDTMPVTFGELVRISGLSHGTDVWLNNAQDIVRSNIAPLKETICTRDDIMIYLIHKGLPPKRAFNIMEQVRKGKGLKEGDEEIMVENGVADWYIDSCRKIKYMFPKAHAVAYVTMGFRVAYYKVHHPLDYYCAYFTVRADDFDYSLMGVGRENVKKLLKHYADQQQNLSAKDKSIVTILEICNEMYARGISFLPVDIYSSHASHFIKEEGKIRPPLTSVKGLGLAAAESIVFAREQESFFTKEDFLARTKVSSTIVELMTEYGCFKGMPESSQLTLF